MISVYPVQMPDQNTPLVTPTGVMTNPGMSFLRALFNRTGQGSGLQNQVNAGVSAAGTTSATATSLLSDWNNVTSRSATATGVQLPALTGGQLVAVFNNAGGNIVIYPPSGATIDGAASYTLATTKVQIFWFLSASLIYSTQLG